MKAFLSRVRRYAVDLFVRHLFWGTICHLRGRHLDLVQVGEVAKKGFRGRPMFQCRRCLNFHVFDIDAKRLGGKAS